MNDKKICFICCVNDEELYKKSLFCINNLEIPEGYEIENICINNAEYIVKAYNEAMKKTDAKYKVYLHQDVFIINKYFIKDVIDIFINNKKIGMVGVAGAKVIPANGIWWESNHKYGKFYVNFKDEEKLLQFSEVENQYENVKCIDGSIIITEYDVFWREDILKSKFFYDVTQSIEFNRAGYEVVVARQNKPWCISECRILNHDEEYKKYRNDFLEGYFKEIKSTASHKISVDSNFANEVLPNINEIYSKILQNLANKNAILSISHSDYTKIPAGTEKLILEHKQLCLEKNFSYIHLFPQINASSRIGLNVDSNFIGYFTIDELRLLLIIKDIEINILDIHIHHFWGFHISSIEKILECVKGDIKFFLHDYYSICPQHNLLKNNISYCGNSKNIDDNCKSCSYGKERMMHFHKINDFFDRYSITFIAPSEVVRDVWLKYYPHYKDKVRVVPHQIMSGKYERNDILNDKKIRIAYVGHQHKIKGWNVWNNLLNKIDDSNYEFYHFGECHTKLPNVINIPVSFIREGKDAMIKALREYHIDVAILWSICPETYSYTYFESYCGGCIIITNPLSGNIAAQVIKNGNGYVLESEKELISMFKNFEYIYELVKKNKMVSCPLKLESNSILIDEIKNN